MKLSLIFFFIFLFFTPTYSIIPQEQAAISTLRTNFSKTTYQSWNLTGDSYNLSIAQLQSDGQFADYVSTENALKSSNSFTSIYSAPQANVANLLAASFSRIWRIAENFRNKPIPEDIKTKPTQP